MIDRHPDQARAKGLADAVGNRGAGLQRPQPQHRLIERYPITPRINRRILRQRLGAGLNWSGTAEREAYWQDLSQSGRGEPRHQRRRQRHRNFCHVAFIPCFTGPTGRQC